MVAAKWGAHKYLRIYHLTQKRKKTTIRRALSHTQTKIVSGNQDQIEATVTVRQENIVYILNRDQHRRSISDKI